MSRDMRSVPSPVSSPIALGGSAPRDEFDPELVALPHPPRQQRTLSLAVLGLAAFAALAMVVALRHDVGYALAPSRAVDLGDLRTVGASVLAACENRPVRAEAILGAAGAIGYERAMSDDRFRVLPVTGRPDVWVEVRFRPGQGNGPWEPPRAFSGRLVRFESSGPRHRGLARAIEQTTHLRVPSDAWLLVDGEDPATCRWVLALAAAFLGFALWHGATMARMLRKVS